VKPEEMVLEGSLAQGLGLREETAFLWKEKKYVQYNNLKSYGLA
jgi:hypothetical protein